MYNDRIVLHVDTLLPFGIHITLYQQTFDEEDVQFFKVLSDVHGIETASFISKYQVEFVKGRVFTWEEIKPFILEIMKERFSPKGSLTEVKL